MGNIYRKSENKKLSGEPQNGNWRAVKKLALHTRLQIMKGGDSKLSSVSLPLFNQRRLKALKQKAEGSVRGQFFDGHIRVPSESEMLTACLVMFLSKFNNKQIYTELSFRFRKARGRIYNEGNYSYVKTSTAIDRDVWLALQMRAVQLEVSLSYLTDIALRLYLRPVFDMVMAKVLSYPNIREWHSQKRINSTRKPGWGSLERKRGIFWLRQICQLGSYQKTVFTESPGCVKKGQKAKFTFSYHLKFG